MQKLKLIIKLEEILITKEGDLKESTWSARESKIL